MLSRRLFGEASLSYHSVYIYGKARLKIWPDTSWLCSFTDGHISSDCSTNTGSQQSQPAGHITEGSGSSLRSSVACMSIACPLTVQYLPPARLVLERLDIKGLWDLPGPAPMGGKPRFFGGGRQIHAARPGPWLLFSPCHPSSL